MSSSSIEERVGRYDPNRPAVQMADGSVMTEGELWGLKNDPRYFQAGSIDPAYRSWVDHLFEVTYPGKQPRVP